LSRSACRIIGVLVSRVLGGQRGQQLGSSGSVPGSLVQLKAGVILADYGRNASSELVQALEPLLLFGRDAARGFLVASSVVLLLAGVVSALLIFFLVQCAVENGSFFFFLPSVQIHNKHKKHCTVEKV